LDYEIIVKCYGGDFEGAIRSTLAQLNLSRSLGDEPILLIQFLRMQTVLRTIECLERIISQGKLDDSPLLAMQTEFESEVDLPIARCALEGERGLWHLYWCNFLETRGEIQKTIRKSPGSYSPEQYVALDPIRVKVCHLYVLKQLSALIDATRLKDPHQAVACAQLDNANVRQAIALVKELTPAVSQISGCTGYFNSTLRCRAIIRCAITAIATERYRLKHHRWPESLDALLPEFLKEASINPFLGDPLCLKVADDQVMIYALEADKQFYDGKLRTSLSPSSRANLGFRLWDPKKRPRPLQVAPAEKDGKRQ
jgi:hypothetical protein